MGPPKGAEVDEAETGGGAEEEEEEIGAVG